MKNMSRPSSQALVWLAMHALVLTVTLGAITGPAVAGDPTPRELLEAVGLAPSGDQRGQMDTVGFVTTAKQMDGVLAQCREFSAPAHAGFRKNGWTGDVALAAAVCPHDDYYYAGRLYDLVMPYVRARTVIVFGVFHKARVFDCDDVLVFDAYNTWHGPYGPVTVSPIRDKIISGLPTNNYTVNNDMHQVEHSIEAIVPWLQAYNHDVEIVPILVPYMDWNTMDRLATDLANVLASIIIENGWELGRDICLISSSDAIHYGDAGWGGKSYADFGTGIDGYQKAVDRDVALARTHLCGPLERPELERFLYTCVDRGNVKQYNLTWCGRFSVPLGLNVASRLAETLEERALMGSLLGYGTSVSEVSLDLEHLDGLGTTAPNNLHHWVGYAAIGYE